MSDCSEKKYKLNSNGEFIISDYNSTKLFSSFFPGVAGKIGIPMWVFYVNRGQCICSMGVEGKQHPIMEFLPANWAYNLVSTQGFRTFIKLPEHPSIKFYEPFQNNLRDVEIERTQKMIISPAELKLEEVNHSLGLKFSVQYFNVPQDNYAGLVRKLIIENLTNESIKLEVLDGLPLIIPYGLDNNGLKQMRRLMEAFVEVTNYENMAPFFKGKVKPADRPDVVRIKKGNFYIGFEKDYKLVNPVVDPIKIFGIRGDYNYPEKFLNTSSEEMLNGQVFENRLPCAMGLVKAEIEANDNYTYNSIIGHAGSVHELNELIPLITSKKYVQNKSTENIGIVKSLTQNNFICSSEPVLDHYARQNFLDNALRGGFPHTIKGKIDSTTLHLYSRKHGDLERDYNDYRLTPTPYSQGNGNFRDVNQNRRCDLFFNPDVKDGNVVHFYNLIQLDGFNPLVIKEIRFTISDPKMGRNILSEYLRPEWIKALNCFMKDPFTPGELLIFLKEQQIVVKGDINIFIGDLLSMCDKKYDTRYGEGFWSDHWTYNLDLLENYLAVYPEKKDHILFEKSTFSFYDNPHRVQPRDDKYVIWDGKAMQLNSVVFDEDKELLIRSRTHDPNKVRSNYGKGNVYSTTLFNKMLSLVVNKLASLDANGVGVEMETDKPNWYDALNGLPGLMGSSISETLEVKRHILFLIEALDNVNSKDDKWPLYTEMHEFMFELNILLKAKLSSFEFWDKATTIKENYRSKTRFGINGKERLISNKEIAEFLKAGLDKLDQGISKAWNKKDNIISTYFVNQVVEYEEIINSDPEATNKIKCNLRGLHCFKAKKFKQTPLPLFLEGPVHYLRSNNNIKHAKTFAENIKKSGLFDKKLKMYKVNESLENQPPEIGRARTFSPGWFENESIWLHMEYKYMLELLRNGLFEQFYDDYKNVFIPFLKPEVYGRSILENSSFIVSSANPDPTIHGNGFVARLSGATAEFVNILHFMSVGQKPFRINQDGKLQLFFKPALTGWLFTKESKKSNLFIDDKWQDIEFAANTFSFMFLGQILVTYHNKDRKNTFGINGVKPSKWKVIDLDGNSLTYQGDSVKSKIAEKIRNREVKSIDIELC